ncbi:MAG: SHOCT domain-containing protein [Bacillota bacterium]|nr:SHOCT domain-containing protein [Bacillota bacterium]
MMRNFGGGFNGNFPVPKGGNAILNNGSINIYSWVNLGLHFLTVIAVILLVAYFFKRLTMYPSILSRNSNKALEILNERYARGEIDTEEFKTRKKTLGYNV